MYEYLGERAIQVYVAHNVGALQYVMVMWPVVINMK